MNQASSMKNELSAAAARHEVAKWVPKLFRAGYAAKGVVYAIIGFLAAKLAFGSGGETTDSKGALREIAEASWGTWALGLVGVGLIGYSLWKFVQSIKDPEGKGSDAEGLIKRAGFFGSGLIHGSLAFTALSMAFGGGGGGGGGGSKTESMTARVLSYEWGVWLVGLAGVVTIIVGLYQFYQAYEASFTKRWHTEEMSPAQLTWGKRAGRLGLAARGVVFSMMGWFFITAARQHDASEASGLEGVLNELATSSEGPWLLGIVAIGLMAYAVFCFVKARYRHFRVA